MGYICCEAYVMADVYLACHVGFYLFEEVHYVKFQPNLVHWRYRKPPELALLF
jgi:hypothetical protein